MQSESVIYVPDTSIHIAHVLADAACVCTSERTGACDYLAQNIVDLIPSLNNFFSSNFTANQVYNKIWLVQGTPPGNCKAQGSLVDVGTGLPSILQPNNITLWAQAALLWTVVQSQDLTESAKLQAFLQNAPWSSFNPSGDASPFTATVLGYTYNFISQTVTPPSASFSDLGQPTADQLSRVSPTIRPILDRMYSFAQGR
jgi:hypothetical protein